MSETTAKGHYWCDCYYETGTKDCPGVCLNCGHVRDDDEDWNGVCPGETTDER